MAITASVIRNSLTTAVIKLVGTALSDTYTLNLSTAITITATGNVTFTAATKTIDRTTGSWVTDGVTVGSVLVIGGTTSNNGTYIVKTVTTLSITIETNTAITKTTMIDETAAAATWTGSYKSDLLSYGQVLIGGIGTGAVNIARLQTNTSAFASCNIVRNSVMVWKLFGDSNMNYSTSEQNTYPIVATFDGATGGTIILELSKINGFSSINPNGLV